MKTEEKTFYSLDVYDNSEESEDRIQSESSPKYVRIDYIKVAREDRGKGKGRELLRAAIAEAKAYGLPVYMVAEQLEPSTDVERLVRFYESEGFSMADAVGDGVLMSL
jgi:GNAT superfamily N-acetyltransferase